MTQRAEALKGVKRVVVKVGTSLLTASGAGLDKEFIRDLASQIAALQQRGQEAVVVTSGAIGAGMARLKLTKRPVTIPEQQAVASVGQCLLMNEYEEAFRACHRAVGQVLLTGDDLSDRRRYANGRQTLLALLEQEIVPVINENDTVAVDELKFGDNDRLSALVALLVDADLLVILTDVDGLFSADPRHDRQASLVPLVERISPSLLAQAGGPGSRQGTGGMATKLTAAQMVTQAGIGMVVANGKTPQVLAEILGAKEAGTFFLPRPGRMDSRKRWIAFSRKAAGTLAVDEGAREAVLRRGKSLLPAGICRVSGDFDFGDVVNVTGRTGPAFAVGVVKYSSGELAKIAGKQSREIAQILGQKYYDEAIHRDDLVVLEDDPGK